MINAHFEGQCNPNRDGGTMSYFTTIYENGELIHEFGHDFCREDDMASNHMADYCGFIAVLKWLLANGHEQKEINITGHSQLVIEQMKGKWEIKEGKYIGYANKAKILLCGFKNKPTLTWKPKLNYAEF